MKIALIVFASIILTAVTCSAEISVDRTVAGLDGYVRGEKWVPVVFDITNTGEDFQGNVEILKGQTTFRKSLHLSASSRKHLEMVYYHSNYYETLQYRILDAKERVVTKASLTVRPLNYQDNLILVISETEYNHQFLNGSQNPWGGKTFVGYLKPADMFPEWLSYSTADAVALGSISPSEIPDSRWKALVLWVASGGVLIASPATSLAVLQDPLIHNNVPAISVEANRLSNGEFLISKWASRSSNPFPQMELPVQTVVARPCDRDLATLPDGSTLITSSPFYKGNILYFGFDYSRLPEEINVAFANYWNGLTFQSIGAPPAFSLPFRKRLEENPRIQKFLYDVPGLKLPDVKWFALFFFVYLLALGPLQYFLLQVLRKRSLLWLTFPLIIILFSVASFGYSRMRHSTQKRITQASVIELYPGISKQIVYQVFGLATNESGTFRFAASQENSYLRKFMMQSFNYLPEPYILSEDLPHQLEGERLKDWTFRTFDAVSEGSISLPVELSLSIHGISLTGKVSNHSGFRIMESFFYYDSKNAATLGPLERGQTREFTLTLDNSSPVPFSIPQLNDLLSMNNLSYANPHFFFGRIEDQAGNVIINGRNRQTNLTQYLALFIETKDAGPVHGWRRTE